ncbi:MAG: hypothetical protein K2O58_11225 [Bacteroidales bacterium]|nr:hypothetical protein [Bacteroidales bacterium]
MAEDAEELTLLYEAAVPDERLEPTELLRGTEAVSLVPAVLDDRLLPEAVERELAAELLDVLPVLDATPDALLELAVARPLGVFLDIPATLLPRCP